ncbi:hypothetical protein V8C42DRAFT_331627 [Trichoderma barbatum]
MRIGESRGRGSVFYEILGGFPFFFLFLLLYGPKWDIKCFRMGSFLCSFFFFFSLNFSFLISDMKG